MTADIPEEMVVSVSVQSGEETRYAQKQFFLHQQKFLKNWGTRSVTKKPQNNIRHQVQKFPKFEGRSDFFLLPTVPTAELWAGINYGDIHRLSLYK